MYKFLIVYGQRYEEEDERRSNKNYKGKSKASVNLKEKVRKTFEGYCMKAFENLTPFSSGQNYARI